MERFLVLFRTYEGSLQRRFPKAEGAPSLSLFHWQGGYVIVVLLRVKIYFLKQLSKDHRCSEYSYYSDGIDESSSPALS